ncbi:hypothetical protein BAOM_2834 [Peribacillus asahii]|uniref:Uncharacterized protein n=1 Tax=Peribacillus asahii TaxID=228899 RepID=A0A3Q9RNA6_9BACI|nr:hypothetical protein BAOM_2834 [Peribacillus asahii]
MRLDNPHQVPALVHLVQIQAGLVRLPSAVNGNDEKSPII